MYNKIGFNNYQIAELERGTMLGVDCSVFWCHHFNNFQMYQIIDGLYKGLDVSIFAKPDFNAGQMREIRLGLESGIDVSGYAKPDIDEYDMFRLREIQETELSKLRYLGRVHIFDSDFNRRRQKYKEFSALVNLDVSKFADYDRARLRAVLPLIFAGQDELAVEYLESDQTTSELAYKTDGLNLGYTLTKGELVDEDILEETYPLGYRFVKQHKFDELDSNDLKVAFIVNQFGEICDNNIEILEAIMVAALCGYDLSYITQEGFDLRFTKIVLDLVDLNVDYSFIFNDGYNFNQKLEIYRAALEGLDVEIFNPEMSLGEMISLRKKMSVEGLAKSDSEESSSDVASVEALKTIDVEFVNPEELVDAEVPEFVEESSEPSELSVSEEFSEPSEESLVSEEFSGPSEESLVSEEHLEISEESLVSEEFSGPSEEPLASEEHSEPVEEPLEE